MKKIVLIGYPDSKIHKYLKENENVFWIDGSEKIVLEELKKHDPDFIILHGCHSILSEDIVNYYPKKIINCHGGYLPWNRGAHPNVWSFIEKTPKGATVHYIDKCIDKGQIIERRIVEFDPSETLEDTYWRIRDVLEDIFIDNWEKIKTGQTKIVDISKETGTLHFRTDLEKVKHLLKDGWKTKVSDLF